MEQMPNLLLAWINEDVSERLFAKQVGDLAAQLAIANQETPNRPLSEAQIERAMDVLAAERGLVMLSLWNRYKADHEEQKLPSYAYAPPPDDTVPAVPTEPAS